MADKDQKGGVPADKLPRGMEPASQEAVKKGQDSAGGAPHSPGEHQPPNPPKSGSGSGT